MTKSTFSPVQAKQSFPDVEREVLAFWEKENIFEKSVKNRRGKPKFVFFDGPPFANGLPHYGHILASSLKDAVTRYWTMKGFYVPRVNGWDCHGLPVEYEIEKELKLSGRKDIEKMGVEVFNKACRESVFRYTRDWQVMLKRIARWVDFEQEYATLQNDYMESIWWVFSEIWKKGLVYQGHKPMHICPRCETSLSNFEVTLGYKEVNDTSVTVKFELVDEPGTYFVAWTTTPWSLLSVTGLAVGPEFDYVKVEMEDGSKYYIAENRLAVTFEGLGEYKVLETVKGKQLVNKKYKHVFDFYNAAPEIIASKNAFHTVGTDYVSVDDGTGIVTINGAFGEIDFEAAKKHELPIIVNVNTDGTFTSETGSYAGMYVKDAEKHIAKELSEKKLLLRKDGIHHSYPHCWRCDTPLLNYATKSWFIKVTAVKDKLLKNNKKIHWVPGHIQDGRFGKWLENARDWNISRNRFWGCPIPIWECECGEKVCIPSLEELQKYTRVSTTIHTLRHGESENNVLKTLNGDATHTSHLTEKGRQEILSAAKKLQKTELAAIVCSPFMRTRESAELLSRELGGLTVEIDDRLREHAFGKFEGVETKEYLAQFADANERYWTHPNGAESFHDIEPRVQEVVNEYVKKYAGKEVLFVTHGDVIRAIARYTKGLTVEQTFDFLPKQAEVSTFTLGELPTRDNKLDLHKPYIDTVVLACPSCDKNMHRIPEVMDCWFESGAMPYAQLHYPFENKKEFESNFPANFIAEGLDQTRGWFYTLHVISTILFNEPAFKNIIVNGILLAADGEKLSKRKKNYPDPNMLFEKHGVDTTRLFLYNSTAPLAEDVRFSEKHVEELVKKFTLTLWNAYSFFVTYATIDGWQRPSSTDASTKNKANKLDEWMISELNVLIKEMTEQMDGYNLARATRPLIGFVDALSNWYVRRSRRRFWKSENDGDKENAYLTLYTVLTTLCKLLAPFMPFISESIYKNLTGESSVHLTDWPTVNKKAINEKLNAEFAHVRSIVSLALSLRSKKLIKVRQPLESVSIGLPRGIASSTIDAYKDVILEEINVKNLIFAKEGSLGEMTVMPDARKIGPRFGKDTQEVINSCKAGDCSVKEDGSVLVPKNGATKYALSADEVAIGYKGTEGMEVASENGIIVALNTIISPALQREGWARDLVRFTQELRKKAGYNISDRIYLFINGDKEVAAAVTEFDQFIKEETLAHEIQEKGDFNWDLEEKLTIDDHEVIVAVRKSS